MRYLNSTSNSDEDDNLPPAHLSHLSSRNCARKVALGTGVGTRDPAILLHVECKVQFLLPREDRRANQKRSHLENQQRDQKNQHVPMPSIRPSRSEQIVLMVLWSSGSVFCSADLEAFFFVRSCSQSAQAAE